MKTRSVSRKTKSSAALATTNALVKKKAAPTKAPSTPPLSPKSPEVPRQSLHPVATSNLLHPGVNQVASPAASIGSSTSGPKATPLPLHILKQLAKDLEGSGGIKVFDGKGISELLNKREALYGKRGSLLRRKVSKKVYRWQLLERKGEYVEKVLNRFFVKSALQQHRERLKSTSKQQQQCEKDASSLSSSSESSVDSTPTGRSDSSAHRTIEVVVQVEQSILPSVIEAPTAGHKTPPPKKPPPAPPIETKKMSIPTFTRTPRSPPSAPLPRDTGKLSVD
jgi:hypothetical protein